MSDKSLGLYEKYRVRRTDGSSQRGCKHENCQYFVLDLKHDKFSSPALLAYADACEKECPLLAADLRNKAAQKESGTQKSIPNNAMKQSCKGCTADEMDCIRCSKNEHVKDYYTTAS